MIISWLATIFIIGLLFTGAAFAAEPPAQPEQGVGDSKESGEARLPEVVVTGERLLVPTKQTGETVYTGTEVTRKGMDVQGVKATTSVYEAVSILPGVNVEAADSRGLGAEQTITRFRGVRASLGAITVLGIPNYGGNPIGPRAYLYDMENMDSAAVYVGAVPADIGAGVGTRGGAIELRPQWPREQFGFDIKQSLGSYNYSRTFFRIDSGTLPMTNTQLMGSFSYTDADKWRGPGGVGPRENMALGLAQAFGKAVDVRLWFNHNSLRQDLYRPLTYQQVRNLAANFETDYNASLTGVAATDINYYKYNTGKYDNYEVFSLITVKPAGDIQVTLKPYYSNEDAVILQGVTAGGGRVQERNRDIKRKGVILEGTLELKPFKAVAGYHFEDSDMNIFTRNFAITSTGLSYRGYGVVATAGNAFINSPHVKVGGEHGPFNWQAGLKYFHFKDPASEGYTTGPAPDYPLVRAPDLDRKEKTYEIWLPSAGISYDITNAIQTYLSYGKNFIRPYNYLPLVNYYSTNRAAFQAAGVTLNDLFKGFDFEESDNIDFGVRFRGERYEVTPTVFFAKHRNLLVTVSDPRVTVSGKPAVYRQNVGKATGYGAELSAGVFLSDKLTWYLNPTVISLTYDDDLTYQGSTLSSKGKQVVDTPQWMVKSGVIYRIDRFEFVPSFRLMGARYADVEHKEKVGSFGVMDFVASYSLKRLPLGKEFRISLELSNIFNRKYVSVINSSDDTRAGDTSYYQGAPLTAMLTASIRF